MITITLKSLKVTLSVFTIAMALLTFNSCEKDTMDDMKMKDSGFNSDNTKKSFLQLKSTKSEDSLEYGCFTVKYPVQIAFEDNTVTVNSEEEEYGLIENWFNENPDSDFFPEYVLEDITFVFPMQIEFGDGEVETVNNQEEFDGLFEF